jgi:flagellar biosynthetic protein FliR
MLTIGSGQLEAWLAQYLWPFIRIGACFMVAPVFGAQFVPPRVRLLLAGAVTLIVAPLVPPATVETFSAEAIVVVFHQILIGVATGFVLQLIFDALAMGGQLLSNTMGLSFAFNVDPLRGASTPVLGQFYMLLVTLTFLALNGHLLLIEIFTRGFFTLPIGTSGLSNDQLFAVAAWGAQLFAGAVSVALPGMTALLVVNLAFGVMSRAAPTLNLFAVGFPVSLIAGLAIVYAGLPSIQASFVSLLDSAFAALRDLLGVSANG